MHRRRDGARCAARRVRRCFADSGRPLCPVCECFERETASHGRHGALLLLSVSRGRQTTARHGRAARLSAARRGGQRLASVDPARFPGTVFGEGRATGH